MFGDPFFDDIFDEIFDEIFEIRNYSLPTPVSQLVFPTLHLPRR